MLLEIFIFPPTATVVSAVERVPHRARWQAGDGGHSRWVSVSHYRRVAQKSRGDASKSK